MDNNQAQHSAQEIIDWLSSLSEEEFTLVGAIWGL